ncbi:MAG: thiamine phosphate synthase [Myxococcaceae bacterium]
MIPRGLYAVCDDTVSPEWPLVGKAEALLRGGVRVMQLRMKRTPVREGLAAATAIAAKCKAAGCVLLVNDRVDFALMAGAHGVHLGEEDLSVEDARKKLGPNAIIGATVRDAKSAAKAQEEGASYVGVGPVFPTSTKMLSHPPLGLDGLRTLVQETSLPVVAISGIGLSNIKDVAATGVHGAAVVSELIGRGQDEVEQRARALSEAFRAD